MPADFLTRIKQSAILCDGAMGTLLYAKGVFINRCYDELNLSDPNLILSIHEDYLQAGAEILETNTFGANRFRLARHGLAGKVAEINAAGVRLAKQAVAHLKEKQAGEAWVAGSVGPLGVRLEPLGALAVLQLDLALAPPIVDLLLGGDGREGPLRELTDIEEAIRLGGRNHLPRTDGRLAAGVPEFQFRAAPDADPGSALDLGQREDPLPEL